MLSYEITLMTKTPAQSITVLAFLEHESNSMTYQIKLRPWAIYRITDTVSHVCIGRFKSRSDAEGHLTVLRRGYPEGRFEVVFDVQQGVLTET